MLLYKPINRSRVKGYALKDGERNKQGERLSPRRFWHTRKRWGLDSTNYKSKEFLTSNLEVTQKLLLSRILDRARLALKRLLNHQTIANHCGSLDISSYFRYSTAFSSPILMKELGVYSNTPRLHQASTVLCSTQHRTRSLDIQQHIEHACNNAFHLVSRPVARTRSWGTD